MGPGEGIEVLSLPARLTRASAETSPPARAAPRSPAHRLSPEREPGRGQGAGCSGSSGRSGIRGRAGRFQRVRRSRRRSQELQLPPARAEVLSYLPPSASAPPGPGALAGWRAGAWAGPDGGGAARRRAGGARPQSAEAPGRGGGDPRPLGKRGSESDAM